MGGLYHIIVRGNRRQTIFFDDDDRRFFLAKARGLKRRLDLEVYAFVLMPNHVHLVLRRMHDPVSRFMASLLTAFARYFNRKYGLVGHVFQGRYRGLLCEDETYLLRLVRYVHRNPMRAGLAPGVDFVWSSYVSYLEQARTGLVDPAPVLARFGTKLAPARAAFRDYHESEAAAAETKGAFMPRRGAFVGSEAFEEREKRRAALSNGPRAPQRPRLVEILRRSIQECRLRVDPIEVRGPSRRHAASLARSEFVESAVDEHGYEYVEVAGFLGRSPECVRVILARRRASRGPREAVASEQDVPREPEQKPRDSNVSGPNCYASNV